MTLHGTRFSCKSALIFSRYIRNKYHKNECSFAAASLLGGYQRTHYISFKIFKESENDYARNVMIDSDKSYQIFPMFNTIEQKNDENSTLTQQLPTFVVNPTTSTSNLISTDVLENFGQLTKYCRSSNTYISDARFDNFIELFDKMLLTLDDKQLEETFRFISLLPKESSPKSPNYVKLWNTLDFVCTKRADNWTINYLLFISDAWYNLNLSRICKFVKETLRRLGREASKMTPEQLVQAMFLFNMIRRPTFDMINFEIKLANCASALTLKELGVVSLGFFKTQTQIRDPKLLEMLYHKLMDNLDDVEDITLVSILKILRYSTQLQQVDLINKLLEKLEAHIARFSLLSCLHIALLGSELQCCNDKVLEHVLKRFNDGLEQTRLKDLERVCFAIGVTNLKTATAIENEVCQKVLPILRKKIHEILLHPRCFATCLQFISWRGYHDAELLSAVLNPNFLKHAYGHNCVHVKEIFYLDSYIEINMKDSNYQGNRLNEKTRRAMGKFLTNYMPERNPAYKLNVTDRILMEIKETTNNICYPNRFKHLLPHFERPDIVICYDNKNRKAINISTDCPEDYTGAILTRKELLGDLAVDSTEIDVVALVVVGWNNVVRNKNRNTGLFDMKLKQLQLLGHKFVLIYWHEWRSLENQMDRTNFIKRKLSKIIKL